MPSLYIRLRCILYDNALCEIIIILQLYVVYPACVGFIALENTADIAHKKGFQVFETTFECINVILSLCV